MKLDTDGRLAVSEDQVQQTCIEWLLARNPGAQYIRTDASDRRRSGAPAHAPYTLDGVFLSPNAPLFVEWKRRRARTAKKRLSGQRQTAFRLQDFGYEVLQIPEGLADPIGWFQERARNLGW